MKYFGALFFFLLSLSLVYMYVHVHMHDKDPSVLVFNDANSRDTYFTMHNIREAQAISRGEGCKVGVLDHSFGVDKHPELYAGGKNFTKDSDESLTKDEWHGYWMAVTLHEIAPEAKIYALNTYSFKFPELTISAIENAIDWAIENNLSVLTYSHRAIKGEERKILNLALDRAHKAGIVTTFIHTGHPDNILPFGLWKGEDDGREPDINVLQYDYNVVKVQGWDEQKESIKNSGPPNFFSSFYSFSSMSPVVGGVVALMKSLRPDLSSSDCQTILRKTARPFNYRGQNPPRVLDALAAIKYVKAL